MSTQRTQGTQGTQLYDEIGEAFEGFKALPLARYGEVPSILALVGDVRGKSVLDLASGTGFYSREFKRRGAADVLGIDISSEMVAVARRMEEAAPLGVRYEVGDAAELRELERQFDIGVGVQLLSYAPDIAAMERMCRNIHRSLKPGGEFFILNQSPDFRFDGPSIDKYGFRSELTGEEAETGPLARLTAHLPGHPVSFVTPRPRREVYENALTAAGFTDLEWVPLHISEAGISEYGEEFWTDLFVNPPLELLRCRA
ncbi:class I SAM-dependent methyltransferase [Streptomyces sp. TRM66268-LWL]|uniref:Class I SAM-dependent methyltransferase n=1 Tax=Streptomyces polyasparticus TaxID=2767826 RepID=A0ABR7SKJ3_9ACTN|nr:class I SAM-dependent methyltransferase [Streptomyces polyasparticus]MBC9715016.1 class I SAM-dependent methyltransferase [Streptomyces polyasparticus]